MNCVDSSSCDPRNLIHIKPFLPLEQKPMAGLPLPPSKGAVASPESFQPIRAHLIETGLVPDAARPLNARGGTSNAGSLAHSHLVFERIPHRDAFAWNAMIRALSHSRRPEKALLLYCQMPFEPPTINSYTFPFLLKACVASPSADTRQVHCHVVKHGFAAEVHTANALLHAYARSGSVDFARRVFDGAPIRDAVTWNSMIDGYARSGRLNSARQLFDLMPNRNVVSWTTMIASYVESCLYKEALELFRAMQLSEIKPDVKALTCALTASAHLGALDQGRWIHNYVRTMRLRLDPALGCVLVHMYAKCGELEEAISVFDKITERNVAVWTAMIAGYAVHGFGRKALDLFVEMEAAGVKPNHITFTSVLAACSHEGLVEEGIAIFEKITRGYDMSPSMEHYGCMVDLLSRAGMFKEAEDLINKMPFRPNVVVWGALANGCRIHKNIELGKHVGKILIELEPEQSGRYMQLAGILAAEGRWDESMAMRKLMKEKGVPKLPGCSSISVKGSIHEFTVGDRSHPQTKEIYVELERILKRLKEEGYVPCVDNLLLDLEGEEKETAIGWHSEKLAIAFGFISTEPGTSIQIVKNIRVCSDCHTVSKLISKVYDRKIIMRDRVRFHVFVNGTCSCKDYW